MAEGPRKNFFEILGTFIPGYRGYREKEMRRDTDRLLRDTIVAQLQDKKRVIDDTVRELSQAKKFDPLEALESIRRRVDQVSDTIRHAPQGYSAFFDTVQIGNAALDRVYRYDLGLKEKVDEFAAGLGRLPSAKDLGRACKELQDALLELTELARGRDEALMEVA